ncbi:unnamed protein product [Calypogeia fissa]
MDGGGLICDNFKLRASLSTSPHLCLDSFSSSVMSNACGLPCHFDLFCCSVLIYLLVLCAITSCYTLWSRLPLATASTSIGLQSIFDASSMGGCCTTLISGLLLGIPGFGYPNK